MCGVLFLNLLACDGILVPITPHTYRTQQNLYKVKYLLAFYVSPTHPRWDCKQLPASLKDHKNMVQYSVHTCTPDHTLKLIVDCPQVGLGLI